MAAKVNNDEVITEAKVNNDTEKRVKIKLFKGEGKYKEDVFVSVNGRNFQIQRGVEVEVPEYVKEVLDNAQIQQEYADNYADEGWKKSLIKQD